MPPENNAGTAGEQTFTQDLLGDAGGEAAGGNAGAGAGASGGDAGKGANQGGTGANAAGTPSFRDQIPQEFREAGWLKNVNDLPTLIKNYSNAQKMIGADKIPLPGPNATAEELRGVLSKIGLPEKLEDYKPEIPKEIQQYIDPKFMEGYSKFAHEAGILPGQAAKVVEYLTKMNLEQEAARVEQIKGQIVENQKALKTEWGQAYDENIARARAAIKQFGGDDALKHARERGYTNDPAFVKLMAKAGEALGEDVIKGEGGTGASVLSPEQARAKLAEIKAAGLTHPYYDTKHSGHEAAKEERRKLFAAAFPEQKSS
jgi:hypothetical protein